MKFDNLIGVLQDLGIDISSTEVAANWMQLTVAVFALFSMLLLSKAVLEECTTRVKILAGFFAVSASLVKVSEYLEGTVKSREFLKYSTYMVYVSILISVFMVVTYKFYGKTSRFSFGRRGKNSKKGELVEEKCVEDSFNLDELEELEEFNLEG